MLQHGMPTLVQYILSGRSLRKVVPLFAFVMHVFTRKAAAKSIYAFDTFCFYL